MSFFKMTADILKIDLKVAKETLDDFVLKEFRLAAKEFVREAVPRIPVDTGMARGTFLHLGRLLRVAVQIKPKKQRIVTIGGRNYVIHNDKVPPPRYWHPPARGAVKNKELGASLATVNGEDISEFSEPNQLFKQIGGKFQFVLSSKTFHLTLNDLVGSKGTGPWEAFKHGEEKMWNRLNTMHQRFPKIEKFLLRSRISVGKSGAVSQETFEPMEKRETFRRGE